MKQILFTLPVYLLTALLAQSAMILEDAFPYENGPLVLQAGGLWTTLSGTAEQLEVLDGRVKLTQAESEDVSALLPGAPYAGPALYASFIAQFSALPNGAGNYFAHFRDATATGFRCRVHASTAGASPGMLRVGIANAAGTPEFVPLDLDLNTDYLLVIRYQPGSPSSLWIDPVAESSIVDRVDATDATSSSSISFFGLRQAGSNPGMGVLTVDNLKIGSAFADVVAGVDPRLNPPTLTVVPDQSLPANTHSPAIPFVVGDGETDPAELLIYVTSDDPGLLPESGLIVEGLGANRILTLTPAPSQQGTTRLTLTVIDSDDNAASRSFLVTVGAPALAPVGDQFVPVNTAVASFPVTVADAESDVLVLAAVSTNADLVASPNITFAGTGANRTIQLRAEPGVSGLTRITVYLTDGYNSVSNSFLLTVFPTAGVVFSDPFAYPDGSVVTNSLFTWTTHSAATGQTGQTQVIQEKLLLRNAQSEDIHALLTNAPYKPAGAWVLYVRFTVNFIARPSATPDFFAHFRGAAIVFGARLFDTSSGAAPGKLRLGISNDSSDPSAILPLDLDTNTSHAVVARYSVATGQSTLWINPAAESDFGVSATDEPSTIDVWSYAFRQSSGIGALLLDDFKIGTRFSDVMPMGYRLSIQPAGPELEIRWPLDALGYKLQSNDSLLPDHWNNVPGLPDQVDNQAILRLPRPATPRFYRLTKD